MTGLCLTQEGAAEHLGISRAQVQRIQARAESKLKDLLIGPDGTWEADIIPLPVRPKPEDDPGSEAVRPAA